MRYGSSCLGMYVAMYDELRKHGTRLVLIACCLAILSIGENSTAIMAALPAMASSLRMRPATVEWAVNAYLLASAVFIIMGGEVADLFGARRSSAAGCVLFALASLMMVVAPNGIVVVGARALQGLGAAFAVAGTLAAATQAVPEAERAKAVGAWTGFLLLGFSIGPLRHHGAASLLQSVRAESRRPWHDCRRRRPVTCAPLGCAVCVCAGRASTRSRDRSANNDGCGLAAAHRGLYDRGGILCGGRICDVAARSIRDR